MPVGISALTPLANITLGAATSSVTFSSISQSYSELILVANVSVTSAGNFYQLRFNGDTSTTYRYCALDGTGSVAGVDSGTTSNALAINAWGGSLNGTLAVMRVEIQNYSATTKWKSIIARGSNSGRSVGMTAASWQNTAAINSIYCFAGGDNFSAGSTFALYGVSA